MMKQLEAIPQEDLPIWMRQAQRGRDWGLILVIAFSVLAAWPFVINTGLSRTNATENHVYMTADFSDALQEGRLYPRWSANVFSGYGAPIPNYYPPGAPYAAALIKVLFTNDAVVATRILFILGTIVAGASTYLFVRRRTSAPGGILAAALFLYSPYFGNVAPYMRGDVAEYTGLALVPLLLFCVDRLATENRQGDILSTGVTAAALILTHPGIAMAAGLLVSGFVILSSRFRAWPRIWFAFGLGMGLSAFFWLPALAERTLVTWMERPVLQHLSWDALLRPLSPVDLGQLLPAPQFTLGLPLLILVPLTGILLIFYRNHAGEYLRFTVFGVVALVVGITSFSSEVWLLGLASLCLCVAASVIVDTGKRLFGQLQQLLTEILLTLLLMASLPVLLAPVWSESFGNVEPVDQIQYEQQTGGVAVLASYHPVPTTLRDTLTPNRFLLSGYQAGNINKIVPAQSTSRTQINLIDHDTHRERFQIASDTGAQLSLLTAHFPGWEATASGSRLHLSQNSQTGLIELQIPPMSGDLTISLESTSIRYNAWIISGITLPVMLLVMRRRRQLQAPSFADIHLLTLPEARLLAIIFSAFAIITVFFTPIESPVTLHAQPGYRLSDAIPLRNRTSVGLEALAYSLDRTVYRPGESLRFTVYWQALRPLPENYQVQAYLIEAATGIRWHRTERRMLGNYPTRRWRSYRYVDDEFAIPLSTAMVQGEYRIAVEVLDCITVCNRLNFFDQGGQYAGQTLILPVPVRIIH